MKVYNFAVALTLTASFANAQQDGLAQLDQGIEQSKLDQDESQFGIQKGDVVNHSDAIWEDYDQDDDEDSDEEEDSGDSSGEDGESVTIGRQLKRRKGSAKRAKKKGKATDGNTEGKRKQCNKVATDSSFSCWYGSDKYIAQTRWDKLEELMHKIEETETSEPADFMWARFPQFFTQKAAKSFNLKSDQLPSNRHKITHTQGLTAHVEWETVDNDYGFSGIYGSGSETVLLRLSQTSNLTEDANGLHPSIALKFLVDGEQSTNVVAMQAMVASGDWNFLGPILTNRLKGFDTSVQPGYISDQTLRKKIIEATRSPFAMGIGGVGKIENDGSKVEEPKIPYQLFFKAPDYLQEELDDSQLFDDNGDYINWTRDVKSRVQSGDIVYEVWAQYEPVFRNEDLEAEDKVVKIANIRMKSDFMTSEWADLRLFFKHDRIKEDRKSWPRKWRRHAPEISFSRAKENLFGNEVPYWPTNEEEAEDKFIDQVTKWGCPFEWLMPEGWSFR